MTALVNNNSSFDMDTLDKMQRFAEVLENSMSIPQRYRGKPADIITAFLKGQELGLAPISALEAFQIVQGTPSLHVDFFMALIMSHPQYEGHEEMTFSEIEEAGKAVCTFIRNGNRHTAEYSIKDAQRGGRWGKGSYLSSPWRMLQIRARSFAGRDAFSDALKGFVTVEDAEDIAAMKADEAKVRREEAQAKRGVLPAPQAPQDAIEGEFTVEVKQAKVATDERHKEAQEPPKAKAKPKPKPKPKAKPLQNSRGQIDPHAPFPQQKPEAPEQGQLLPPSKGLKR